MKLDARVTRRSAIALAASLLLAGCASGAPAGSGPADPAASDAAWTATLAADAPILNVEGELGAAIPGECWAVLEDGTIQVQVAGSSIPEPEVESVELAEGTLTVTMAEPDQNAPATMDYVLHQFIVEGGDAEAVEHVELVRAGQPLELPSSVVVTGDPLAE